MATYLPPEEEEAERRGRIFIQRVKDFLGFTPPERKVQQRHYSIMGRVGDWGSREGLAIPAPVSSYAAPASPQNLRILGRSELENLVKKSAKKHKVPVPLALKVAGVESNWDQKAVSSKGAVGVMQLMKESFPGVDIHDPVVNIDTGVKYLAELNKKYKDPTWRKPVIAYNMGPDNFDRRKFNRKLWKQETINYEKKIFPWDDRKLRRK